MNNCNKQNEKIELIDEKTLIVGVDIGSNDEYARLFTWRKIELSKKAFHFTNDITGFESFHAWVVKVMESNNMNKIIVGMEPTSIYWEPLATYCKNNGMIVVHVNPAAVKKSKELDDNDPSKNDRKDPKVIAGLVTEGRYQFPFMPEEQYAALRELSNLRLRTKKSLCQASNRLERWYARYFPEFKTAYKDSNAKTAMLILEDHPLPSDIVALGEEGILKIWREHKVRGAGKTRARKLYEAAERSVGRTEAPYVARMEFRTIMEDIKRYQQRLDEIEQAVDQILPTVKNAEKLLEIPGVGKATVVTFLAEVGDISRFRSAKEIQKLAGLAIVTNESCKHKGATCISYRGRKTLRWILYEAALSLVGRNKEFNQIHQYYTTREKNPLKGIQSVVAVACKVIRIFYKILTTGVSYDGTKMTMDIVRA